MQDLEKIWFSSSFIKEPIIKGGAKQNDQYGTNVCDCSPVGQSFDV